MTPEQLWADAERAAKGDGHLIYRVPKKSRPGNHAALLPGVNGRVLQWDGSHAVLYVRADSIKRWLARRGFNADKSTAFTPQRAPSDG